MKFLIRSSERRGQWPWQLRQSLSYMPSCSPPGVANADVCAGFGRRVSVSGCTNVADTVNTFAPPPDAYAPLPQDFPAPATTATAGRCLRREK